MSIGALLTDIFDIFWLLSMLALLTWLALVNTRHVQRLEIRLLKSSEDSSRAAVETAQAATQLAQSIATMLETFQASMVEKPTSPPKRATPATTTTTVRKSAPAKKS